MTKRAIVHDLGTLSSGKINTIHMLEIDIYERAHIEAILEGVRHGRKSSNMHSHY